MSSSLVVDCGLAIYIYLNCVINSKYIRKQYYMLISIVEKWYPHQEELLQVFPVLVTEYK